MKISMVGGGSWGTTLAQLLSDNSHDVLVNDINQDFVNKINDKHEHPFFNATIPANIKATTSLKEACDYAEIIVLCVPTKFMRDVLKEINKIVTSPKMFINVSKGIEPVTSLRISQILEQEIDSHKIKSYTVLSGPSHAEELILRKLTTLVAASIDNDAALLVQNIFSNDTYLRVYTSDDVIGVETGGAIKNAIAVVSGIASGLGLGENARAALISRGIREIVAIVEALGGKKETAYGLSGVGDLIVTASSLNSRNFQAGLKIGAGESLDGIMKNAKMAIEGVRTIEAAVKIGNEYNLELPIIEMAYRVIFDGLPLTDVVNILLNRKLKSE